MGYSRAGFDVLGVDIDLQPRYPFRFVQADALEYLDTYPRLHEFAAVHASPPCQGYSYMRALHDREYPLLIADVRAALVESGLPWVIENVEGAKSEMLSPLTLCGSQFGRTTWWPNYGRVQLRRHRLFEASCPIPDRGPHDHTLKSVPVYGHGPGGVRDRHLWPHGGLGMAKAAKEVMGIDWMTYRELSQAIPPCYTEYVGGHLMQAVSAPRLEVAA